MQQKVRWFLHLLTKIFWSIQNLFVLSRQISKRADIMDKNIREKIVSLKEHIVDLRHEEELFIESLFATYNKSKIGKERIGSTDYEKIKLEREYSVLCEVDENLGKFVVTHVCGFRPEPYYYSVWVCGYWESDYSQEEIHFPSDKIALGELYVLGLILHNQNK